MKSQQNEFNIIFVAYNYYKEDLPSWPGVNSVYCNYLPEYGANVELLLSADQHHFEKKKFLNATLSLIPNPYYDKFSRRILSILRFNISLLLYLAKKLKKERISIIQFRNDVPSAVIGLILGKIYKVPCVFNYDSPLGYFVELYSKEKLFRGVRRIIWKYSMFLFEKVFLKNFDFVLPITHEYKKDLKSLGIPMEKMTPFPLGIDPKLFQNNLEKLRERLGLSPFDIVFIYVGSITKQRHLENVLIPFSRIIQVNPNVKLVFVGDGDAKTELEELAKHLNIDSSVFFVGRVPYIEVPCYIKLADFGVSLLPPVNAYRVSSPCKVFEYLYSKVLPIVNIEIPEQKEAIIEGKAGIPTIYDQEKIKAAFLEAIYLKTKNLKTYKKMQHLAQKTVVERRHFKKLAERIFHSYLKILEGL
ncbi:MAG: glycosyltransferase [Candidatus Marinimicrobia bacterium]|nr:glycosyltransferase [Candidatus Neomarinimicrobiota bacterium]